MEIINEQNFGALLITGLIHLFFGISVLKSDYTQKTNQTFSAFAILLGIWNLTYALVFIETGILDTTTKTRIITIPAILFAPVFLWLTKIYPNNTYKLSKRLSLFYATIILFLFSILNSPLYIPNAEIQNKMLVFEFGPLYLFFTSYSIGTIVVGVLILIKKYTKATSANKRKIQYVFTGVGISVILGTIFTTILPSMGLSKLSFLAPIGTIFVIAFWGWAITKHGLLDLSIIITRTLSYTSILTLVILSTILITTLDTNITIITLLTILNTLFWAKYGDKLRQKIQTTSEKKWVTDWYDETAVVKQVSEKLSKAIATKPERDGIIRTMLLSISDILDLKEFHALSAILNEDGRPKEYKLNNKDKSKSITLRNDHELIIYFKTNKHPTLWSNLPKSLQVITKELEISKHALFIPLHSSQYLEGIMILGQRLSEAKYELKDISLMEVLQRTTNVFLDGIKPYETIQRAYAQKERQLARSQKIASMTQMIQNYNHEIRTPLSIIKDRIKLYKTEMPFEDLKTVIVEEIDRAIDIVETTLSISDTKRERQETDVDIHDLIEKALRLVPPDGVSLHKNLSDTLPQAKGVHDDLYMVFTNLIKNAIEAMPNGGSLTITTQHDKSHIQIEISDSGVGIDHHRFEEIFEPFSTSHETKGRGLGLPVVHSIIREHLGTIEVKSDIGKGASFIVRIPIQSTTGRQTR